MWNGTFPLDCTRIIRSPRMHSTSVFAFLTQAGFAGATIVAAGALLAGHLQIAYFRGQPEALRSSVRIALPFRLCGSMRNCCGAPGCRPSDTPDTAGPTKQATRSGGRGKSLGNVAGSATDHDRIAHGHLKSLNDFRGASDVEDNQRVLTVKAWRPHPRNSRSWTRLAILGNGCGLRGCGFRVAISEHVHLGIVRMNLLSGNGEKTIHARRNLAAYTHAQSLLTKRLNKLIESGRGTGANGATLASTKASKTEGRTTDTPAAFGAYLTSSCRAKRGFCRKDGDGPASMSPPRDPSTSTRAHCASATCILPWTCAARAMTPRRL